MIYFDNASTTKMDDKVKEIVIKSYEDNWANPSSLHKLGFQSEKAIDKARGQIASQLKISAKNLFFVPSGTIANNAILNSFNKKGNNIVISEVEHSSSYYASKYLQAEVRYAKVDSKGFIIKEDLLSKIDENTKLVSLIHVNNELGSINDINALASEIKKINPNVKVHSDGVQAFKKIDISLKDIDFYTISSHKIHGPKGIAALYIRDVASFEPLYYGGNQEGKLFSGTENINSIIGFGFAAELEENHEKIKEINKYIREELSLIKDSKIVSPEQSASPYIINVCFKGIGAEILLHYLEMEDIYISTGSACNKGEKSRVIEAIELDEIYKEGCIRISLCKDSTIEEAEKFIEVISDKIELIRSIIG